MSLACASVTDAANRFRKRLRSLHLSRNAELNAPRRLRDRPLESPPLLRRDPEVPRGSAYRGEGLWWAQSSSS